MLLLLGNVVLLMHGKYIRGSTRSRCRHHHLRLLNYRLSCGPQLLLLLLWKLLRVELGLLLILDDRLVCNDDVLIMLLLLLLEDLLLLLMVLLLLKLVVLCGGG